MKISNEPAAALAAVALAALAAAGGAWAAEGPSLSGSSETRAAVRLDDLRLGLSTELRLVLEARPSERASFRAEASAGLDYGAASGLAWAIEAGLAAPAALPPGADPRLEAALEQAYASILAGPFDLRAGLVPIAWGSAYFFNPSSRLARPRPLGDEGSTETGLPAAELSLSLAPELSLSAYAAFRDRAGALWPSAAEGEAAAIPLGARIQYRGGLADLALCVLRETNSFALGESGKRDWVGLDLSAALGSADLYLEAALAIDGGKPIWEEDLDAAAGIVLPLRSVTLRLEYDRHGGGAVSPAEYDWAGLLTSARGNLGKDYLFAMARWEPDESWSLHGGGLINLDDGSWAIAAEAAWLLAPEAELSLALRWLGGERGSEFDGRFLAAPGRELDLARPLASLGLRLDF